VRLPSIRRDAIARAGLKTAGYNIRPIEARPSASMTRLCGPRKKLLDQHAIRFVPGLNEELAVSAIRGTQELEWFGKSQVEGVFGLWYGKGIGVDRACESLKLGNLEGASAKGGFLAVAGDDHGGKSSDSAHQSEPTLMAAFLPILYPATIGEILEFGLFGWAIVALQRLLRRPQVRHRHVGSSPQRSSFPTSIEPMRRPPTILLPPQGLNLRPNQPPLIEEEHGGEPALAGGHGVRACQRIDRTVIDGERRSLAIVSRRQGLPRYPPSTRGSRPRRGTVPALRDPSLQAGPHLAMDKERLVRVRPPAARPCWSVEEKRPVMEDQIARHLYAVSAEQRAEIAGKQDLKGAPLFAGGRRIDAGPCAPRRPDALRTDRHRRCASAGASNGAAPAGNARHEIRRRTNPAGLLLFGLPAQHQYQTFRTARSPSGESVVTAWSRW